MPDMLVIADGRMGERACDLLTTSGVSVRCVGPTDAMPDVASYDAVVLAASRPYPSACTQIDAACWSAKRPWIAGITVAHEFRVGPGVVPGRTPCFECFSRRLRAMASDLAVHTAIDAYAAHGPPGPWFRGELPAITEQAASILAAEAIALTRTDRARPLPRMGHYWEGDAVFGPMRGRVVARIGLCAVCCAEEQRGATFRGLAAHFGGADRGE
jgi:bacteriocin biosynthesis cyclodehydratase domain-containing protein